MIGRNFCFVFCFCHISATSSSSVSQLSHALDTRTHFLLDSCPTDDDDDDDGGEQNNRGERKSENGTLKMPINSTIGKTVDGNLKRLCPFGHWQSFTGVRWHQATSIPMCGEWFTPLNSLVCLFATFANQIMESGQIYQIKNKQKKELRKVIPEKTNGIWAIGIIIRTKKIWIWLLSTKVHVSIGRW